MSVDRGYERVYYSLTDTSTNKDEQQQKETTQCVLDVLWAHFHGYHVSKHTIDWHEVLYKHLRSPEDKSY